MKLLDNERAALRTYLPGLDEFLCGEPLTDLESAQSKGIAAFRDHRGPALLVPAEHSGSGASALDAVRVQLAIGSRSPSLAVATTMHHFSVASLVEMAESGLESILLEGIARERLLVASGFAEGNPGQGILSPTMSGKRVGKAVVLSGTKRP